MKPSKFHCRTECLGLQFALRMPIEQARVYAVSAGGVEVAQAIASFQERPIVWVEDPDVEAVRAVPGEPAYLVDDGLSAASRLAVVLRSLRAGQPSVLRLVTPWLTARDRAVLGRLADDVVTITARPPRLEPYDDPAHEEDARRVVQASRHRSPTPSRRGDPPGDDPWMRLIDENIRDHGVHVQAVLATAPGEIPWTYTIGLFREHGHPEIVISGLPVQTAHSVSNEIARQVAKGRRIVDGEVDDRLVNAPVTFKAVPPELYGDEVGLATKRYGGKTFPLLQLVWPDARGRWPWDAAYVDDPPQDLLWIRG